METRLRGLDSRLFIVDLMSWFSANFQNLMFLISSGGDRGRRSSWQVVHLVRKPRSKSIYSHMIHQVLMFRSPPVRGLKWTSLSIWEVCIAGFWEGVLSELGNRLGCLGSYWSSLTLINDSSERIQAYKVRGFDSDSYFQRNSQLAAMGQCSQG